MEEKEITYIPYGLDEISQQDLMTNIANETPNFIKRYKWLLKPEIALKFVDAVKDISTHGITGASSDSGVWEISHGGDKIDLDTMSPIDRKVYEMAAFHIQQQMALTPTKKKEEEKKETKTPFNFLDSFKKRLLEEYGGNESLFADPEYGWNAKDERGENGLRGIDKRRDALKAIFEDYLKNYKDGENNFEGTSFTDDNDVRTKLLNAINALGTIDTTTDDVDAFNALGLPYRAFFSNGGNDKTTNINPETGQPFTYTEWSLYQLKQNELKNEQKKQTAYNNTLFLNRVTNSKMLGQNPTALKEKYKDSNSLIAALQNYALRDIRTLSPDEQSEIQGAYRYLANLPIDNKLLKQIQSSSSGLYKNSAPNRFKKINGIDNLIWDSSANQIIQINTRELQQAILNLPLDLFANVLTDKDKELEYLNSKIPGITNAEWKELSAIGLDIASIIDPEAITGSAMALGAAGLRHSAKNDSNSNWSFGDYFWQGVDYLTGALGGIQVFGDAVLSAKTMATASKAIPILRKMARLGAWNDLFGLIPDLAEATRKVTNGEELTVKDWRAIGQGIRGLVSHGRLNRGNRTERRVLEKSGQSITPENVSSMRGKVKNLSQLIGFIRTKPTNTSEVSTIKATVNGKESEIEISSTTKAKIQEKVNKAGNSIEARNKAVKEVLKEDGKIKESDKIEVEAPSSIRDGRFRPNWIGTSRNLFGTKQSTTSKGEDVFNEYISGNRGYWDRYKYGSNRELKGIYNRLKINSPIETKLEISDNSKKVETPKTETSVNARKKWSEIEKGSSKWNRSAEAKEYEEMLRGKFGTNAIQGGVHKIGDLTLDVDIPRPGATNGFAEVSFKDGSKKTIRFDTQKLLLEQIAKIIKERRVQTDSSGKKTKIDVKEMSKILKSLKSKGFLKQGGKAESSLDKIIEDFIKNNNI